MTPNIKDVTPKAATIRDIILTDTAIVPQINVTTYKKQNKFSELMREIRYTTTNVQILGKTRQSAIRISYDCNFLHNTNFLNSYVGQIRQRTVY